MQYWLKGSQNNRPSLDERLHQSLTVAVFKYVNNVCPYYLREIFEPAMQGSRISRNILDYATKVFLILVPQYE